MPDEGQALLPKLVGAESRGLAGSGSGWDGEVRGVAEGSPPTRARELPLWTAAG